MTIKGKTTVTKLGNKLKDSQRISNNPICRLFKVDINLEICKSHAIETKIKKINEQDFNISDNMYNLILLIKND